MIKKSIRPILFFLCLISSNTSFAIDFDSCLVKEVIVIGETLGEARLDCTISNTPACAVNLIYLGFDKSTQAGKDYLQLLMFALENNAKVTGTVDHNVCFSQQPNVPLLNHLRVTR